MVISSMAAAAAATTFVKVLASPRNIHLSAPLNSTPLFFSFRKTNHLNPLPGTFSLFSSSAGKRTSREPYFTEEEDNVYGTFAEYAEKKPKYEHSSEEAALSVTPYPSGAIAAPHFTHLSPMEGFENGKSKGADSAEVAMVRRLFERPTTGLAFHTLRSQLTPVLVQRLRHLLVMEPTAEVGLEMADSVYVLNLLGSSSLSSNEKFAMGGKKAAKGARLLLEGARLLAHGRELVESAVAEMPEDFVN